MGISYVCNVPACYLLGASYVCRSRGTAQDKHALLYESMQPSSVDGHAVSILSGFLLVLVA